MKCNHWDVLFFHCGTAVMHSFYKGARQFGVHTQSQVWGQCPWCRRPREHVRILLATSRRFEKHVQQCSRFCFYLQETKKHRVLMCITCIYPFLHLCICLFLSFPVPETLVCCILLYPLLSSSVSLWWLANEALHMKRQLQVCSCFSSFKDHTWTEQWWRDRRPLCSFATPVQAESFAKETLPWRWSWRQFDWQEWTEWTKGTMTTGQVSGLRCFFRPQNWTTGSCRRCCRASHERPSHTSQLQ